MIDPKMFNNSDRVIRDSIQTNSLKKVFLELKKQIEKEFSTIKKNLLLEFDNHPITKEIEMGPTANNISGTLGKGNLFSFLGFKSSQKPTAIIREALNQTTIRFEKPKKGRTISISFHVDYPTIEYIYSITPLPWASGRSWVWSIERGVSGIGQYVYLENKDLKSSRSGPAIQNKNQKVSSRFKNSSYLTRIIRNFEKNINSLNKKYLK